MRLPGKTKWVGVCAMAVFAVLTPVKASAEGGHARLASALEVSNDVRVWVKGKNAHVPFESKGIHLEWTGAAAPGLFSEVRPWLLLRARRLTNAHVDADGAHEEGWAAGVGLGGKGLVFPSAWGLELSLPVAVGWEWLHLQRVGGETPHRQNYPSGFWGRVGVETGFPIVWARCGARAFAEWNLWREGRVQGDKDVNLYALEGQTTGLGVFIGFDF